MISKVHLVFKTHLDVGFTDLASQVVKRYFESYIPRALALAKATREESPDSRFVWTVGSWLVYEYLEQAAPQARRNMEQAITQGDIVWHGLPFTTHSELLDPGLFRIGLSLSQRLDRRFGTRTVAAKMTDVPGHTRGIISLLAEAGIRFLHIGINPASTPPAVPALFRWRDVVSKTDVMVMVGSDYGLTTEIPKSKRAFAFSFTGDNHGPQDPGAIASVYEALRAQYPGAVVCGGSLNDWVDPLSRLPRLPVVTSEIGDTWIHGAGTDPTKLREFRELLRLRGEWIRRGVLVQGGKRDLAFSRPLLNVAEHTWGMDEKTHLADYVAYAGEAFKSLRRTSKCRKFESSWDEQRGYLRAAVASLGSSALATEARSRLRASAPVKVMRTGFKPVTDWGRVWRCGNWNIGFNQATGSINRLEDCRNRRIWAAPGHEFAVFGYQTFSHRDYDQFLDHYNTRKPDWAIMDFSKPGIERYRLSNRIWAPGQPRLFVRESSEGLSFVVENEVGAGSVEALAGCPRRRALSVFVPSGEGPVDLDFQWFTKSANRLPEAIWLSFSPPACRASGWWFEKMGQSVSPLDVVEDGNRKLHAIGKGVRYADARGVLSIDSLDAPLVAPGAPSLLDFNNRQPPLGKGGVHFNLYNNIWGTNFPMWFEEDARFRFSLHFGQ